MIDAIKKTLIVVAFAIYVVFFINIILNCAGVTAYEGSEFQSINESLRYMQD